MPKLTLDLSDEPGDEPATRQERIDQMRRLVTDFKNGEYGDKTLSDTHAEELVRWAGLEYAVMDRMIAGSRKIIKSVHPSIDEETRLGLESSMLLLEAAGIEACKCGAPLDVMLKAYVQFHTHGGKVGGADEEETTDLENLLFSGEN